MDRGVFKSSKEAESTSVTAALDWYIDEIVPRKKTTCQRRDANRVRFLQKHLPFAPSPMAAVNGKDIMTFIRQGEKGALGANTIRLDLALLSHLFKTARTAWGTESLSNPVDLIKGQRPKLPFNNPGNRSLPTLTSYSAIASISG